MKKEIQIAILAIVTLAASIWGFSFISGKNMFSGDQYYYAIYDDVQDVNTATPVQINGYEVGTVISILPEPNDISQIRVGFTVKNEIKVPKGAIAQLMASGALGGKRIELIFEKMCDGSNCAPDKSTLEGRNVGLIGSLIGEQEMTDQLNTISTTIDKTIGDLGNPESDDAVDVSVRNLSTTLENFASISANLERLMSRSSKDMEKTLSNMSTLTEALVISNEKMNTMLDNVSTLTADLSQVKLSETINKADGTIVQAGESLKTLESTMENATLTLDELTELLKGMNSSEGSLGMLMKDKDFYENLNSTTKNMNLLLQDIRLNPRRYFKVFGKKVPAYEYPEGDPADGK